LNAASKVPVDRENVADKRLRYCAREIVGACRDRQLCERRVGKGETYRKRVAGGFGIASQNLCDPGMIGE
jgi:predicted DNA-binding ribbon-helix-helix protein